MQFEDPLPLKVPTSQASHFVARGWEYHSMKPYVSMHLQCRRGRKGYSRTIVAKSMLLTYSDKPGSESGSSVLRPLACRLFHQKPPVSDW